jgi:flagellar biosynthesis/type III secretory pathway chaperone
MSKSAVRIVFSVVISVAILIVAIASVQAASSRAGIVLGRPQVTAGLLLDTSHPRNATSLILYNADGDEGGHHCHEEEAMSASDY